MEDQSKLLLLLLTLSMTKQFQGLKRIVVSVHHYHNFEMEVCIKALLFGKSREEGRLLESQ